MELKDRLLEYQLFPRSYFSGSDVYIMINNEVVDEIVSLEVEMSQQVGFVFGYASYTADAVTYGARMVNGKFTVNFRESGYLMSKLGGGSPSGRSVMNDSTAISEPDSSEYIADLVKSGDADKLQEAMQHQEKAVWGEEAGGSGSSGKWYKATLLPGGDSTDVKQNGFDIVISYGDEKFHVGDNIGTIPSGVEVINGVHLIGTKKTIEPTGSNVIEEYTFIAKDFNNEIGSKKLLLNTPSGKLGIGSNNSGSEDVPRPGGSNSAPGGGSYHSKN